MRQEWDFTRTTEVDQQSIFINGWSTSGDFSGPVTFDLTVSTDGQVLTDVSTTASFTWSGSNFECSSGFVGLPSGKWISMNACDLDVSGFGGRELTAWARTVSGRAAFLILGGSVFS